jgi:hypothetical protein
MFDLGMDFPYYLQKSQFWRGSLVQPKFPVKKNIQLFRKKSAGQNFFLRLRAGNMIGEPGSFA